MTEPGIAVSWSDLALEVADLAQGKPSRPTLARIGELERQALDTAPPRYDGERSDLLHALSLFHFYATPEPRNALPTAKAAVHLAERSGDPMWLRKTLTLYGIVAGDTNDIGMAIHCHVKALQLAIRLGDAEAQCAVLNNLGTALTSAAAYREAIECYGRVIATASRARTRMVTQIVAVALANIARCHLHLEEPAEGIEMIRRAIREASEPTEVRDIVARVLMEYTYTRLLLVTGNIADAELRATHSLRYSELRDIPRASIAAQNAKGLVEVFKGEYEAGIKRLTKSLELTNSLQSAYWDTLAALVMASERANRIDLAISYQKELVDATRRMTVANIRFQHALHAKEVIQKAVESDAGVASLARGRLDRLSARQDEYDHALEQLETLERIAVTTAAREDPSGGHPYRVARLVSLLAARTGLDTTACRALDLAVRLHDIGNVGIADRIMLSAHPLTERERIEVEAHPVIGFDLLRTCDGPDLQLAAMVARHHHERWDGLGYPDRLSGLRIPLAARMTGLAETYDALTHARAHRAALDPEAALTILRSGAGSLFDPALTATFVDLVRELRAAHSPIDEWLESGARASRFVQSRRQIKVLLADPSSP